MKKIPCFVISKHFFILVSINYMSDAFPLNKSGFPSHTKTGRSYSAIILRVWFQVHQTLYHKVLWFQVDHFLALYDPVFVKREKIDGSCLAILWAINGSVYDLSDSISKRFVHCSQWTDSSIKTLSFFKQKILYYNKIWFLFKMLHGKPLAVPTLCLVIS